MNIYSIDRTFNRETRCQIERTDSTVTELHETM